MAKDIAHPSVTIENGVLWKGLHPESLDSLVLTISVPNEMLPDGIHIPKRFINSVDVEEICEEVETIDTQILRSIHTHLRKNLYPNWLSLGAVEHDTESHSIEKSGKHEFYVTLQIGERAIALARELKNKGKLWKGTFEKQKVWEDGTVDDAMLEAVAARAFPQRVSANPYDELTEGLNNLISGFKKYGRGGRN